MQWTLSGSSGRHLPVKCPISFGALASSESLVPWQSGQTSSFRNFSTRFMPFSSFTLFSALRTVSRSAVIGHIQITDSCTDLVFWHDKRCAFSPSDHHRRSPFPALSGRVKGTFVRTPISRQTSVIKDHIRAIPRGHGPLVNGLAIRPARALPGPQFVPCLCRRSIWQAPVRVESKIFCRRRIEMLHRTPGRPVLRSWPPLAMLGFR